MKDFIKVLLNNFIESFKNHKFQEDKCYNIFQKA